MKPNSLLLGLVVITILALGSTYYFFNQYQEAQKLLKDPSAISRKQGDEIKAKLSKLIVLPDEAPTIATITDIKQLDKQPFFKNAQNGDKLIIFPKARKAILWRPSSNLIIETAPVNIGQPQGGTTVTPAPTGLTGVPTGAISPTIKPRPTK